MTVDVSWGGVSLAKGASVRSEDGGWFVEIEQPMPVGTRLALAGEVSADVEVARVHEGVGAGMLVKKAGAAATAAAPPASTAATAAAAAVEGEEAPEKEPEKENGGGKKEKRRKKR